MWKMRNQVVQNSKKLEGVKYCLKTAVILIQIRVKKFKVSKLLSIYTFTLVIIGFMLATFLYFVVSVYQSFFTYFE